MIYRYEHSSGFGLIVKEKQTYIYCSPCFYKTKKLVKITVDYREVEKGLQRRGFILVRHKCLTDGRYLTIKITKE